MNYQVIMLSMDNGPFSEFINNCSSDDKINNYIHNQCKRKIQIENINSFDIRECDLVTRFEIYGRFPERWDGDTNLENIEYYNLFENMAEEAIMKKRNLLSSIIKSINLEIGFSLINTFYTMRNNIIINKKDFSIILDFKEHSLKNPFIPIVSLYFHTVKFKTIFSNLQNPIVNQIKSSLKGFLECINLKSEDRSNITIYPIVIPFKNYHQYNLILNDNVKRIYMNLGNEFEYSTVNYLHDLHFNFNGFNIRDSINSINLYISEELVNIFTKNDMDFINDTEFILSKFYHKLFCFNNITIEFDLENPFDNNTKLSLITSNYNILTTHSGLGGIKYVDLDRDVFINNDKFISGFLPIEISLFNEKVLPRLDVCKISHEEITVSADGIVQEELVICGQCFSCCKTNYAIKWFKQKKDKICPYCKTNENWFYYNNVKENYRQIEIGILQIG